MIILYVIGIPGVAFLLLRHNKHKLNDLAVKQKYGFLYSVRAMFFPLGVFQAPVTDIALAFVYRTMCSFFIAMQGYLIGENEGDDSWYYWELLVVARKIAIIVISVRFCHILSSESFQCTSIQAEDSILLDSSICVSAGVFLMEHSNSSIGGTAAGRCLYRAPCIRQGTRSFEFLVLSIQTHL